MWKRYNLPCHRSASFSWHTLLLPKGKTLHKCLLWHSKSSYRWERIPKQTQSIVKWKLNKTCCKTEFHNWNKLKPKVNQKFGHLCLRLKEKLFTSKLVKEVFLPILITNPHWLSIKWNIFAQNILLFFSLNGWENAFIGICIFAKKTHPKIIIHFKRSTFLSNLFYFCNDN